MIKGKETKLVCKCERCGHEWVSMKTRPTDIRVCANCKSPYWNTPKKTRGKDEKKEVKNESEEQKE